MSALLDSLCGALRLKAIAENEHAMNVFSCYEGFHVGEVATVEMPLEPSEEDFVAADIARNAGKGQRLAARNDRFAADAQMAHLDAMRRAGL
jgi:hypothetical protein